MNGGGVSATVVSWVLQDHIHAIEAGDHRRILERGGSDADARGIVLATVMPLLVAVAHSQSLLVTGAVFDARRDLSTAVSQLPRRYWSLPQPDGRARAALLPIPDDGEARSLEVTRVRVARVIWREQTEIEDLCHRAATMDARDALIEACIEQVTRTCFDPYHQHAWQRGAQSTAPPVERRWQHLCARATRLRQIGQPRAGTVSPRVWRELGGYDGLRVAALARLAEREEPASWYRTPGTECLPVRLGLLRAWQHARRLREDLQGWT